jgi:pimeloyl-ACP methyl ester carboxylesterase
MITRELEWSWNGVPIRLGMDEAGSGPQVLLLPALSSISTRSEMGPLLGELAAGFKATAIDWPGFGDRPRPRLDWTPDILSRFLDWLLSDIVVQPHAVVAAGHAATYLLHHAARHPGCARRLVFIAPTWRGPLPTMAGGQRPWFARLRGVFDAPVLGAALYAVNLSGPVVRKMAAGHVYEDPAWLSADRAARKRAVTTASGARHASVRFVTGALDRVGDRAAFLDLARRAAAPILVVYGGGTPRKSRAEMDALAGVAGVETVLLPHGKLGLHEEFAVGVAAEVKRFLAVRP